jgi:hypothetical protein
LPEKGISGVDVSALPILRAQQSALLLRFTRIVAREQRFEMIVPLVHKVKPTFLHPAIEIMLRNQVRRVEHAVVGCQNFNRRLFD